MYRQQHDASAGAEQAYHFSASTPYGYSPFSASLSAYHGSPQHLSPRQGVVQYSPQQHRRHASIGSQRINRSLSATPTRHIPFTPTDRALPLRDVTAETITDAYVTFVLYCNPNFPLTVDTQTLRTTFQSPPKSDNKEFETFRLFELIRKFDAKEIKTWGQLALDLGVEAPDVSKGQSVQKVQQYTVRLKRWMRAMHVDAFFEYLLGKDHSYFNDIPHPSEPHPAAGRDGVVAEEDLAIRALNPSFRPKRGRRRNSEAEQEDADTGPASKQPRLIAEAPASIAGSPHPMSTFSAHPNNAHDPWAVASAVTPATFAPWAGKHASQSAVTTTGPSQLRWQVHDSSHDPSSPHPLTAHPSTSTEQIDNSFDNEPKSAVTPSTRRRRKHGPAVSSAWPSSNGPNAKPRGRPPASRNVQDGPFNTFPADPTSDKSGSSAFAVPVAVMDNTTISASNEPLPSASAVMAVKAGEGSTKPGRLSLQVPPHKGGPVRLATPPMVLVNGETNESDENASQVSTTIEMPAQTAHPTNRQKSVLAVENEVPSFAFETLKKSLTSDFLRAELIGRHNRLSGDEAKRLADAVLERFNIPRVNTSDSQDDIARLTAASWLGLGEHLNVPLGPALGQNKRITVTRFRVDSQGYEEIAGPGDNHYGQDEIREVFDLSWVVSLGGCNGNFSLTGLSLSPAESVTEATNIHDRVIDIWLATAKQVGLDDRSVARMTARLDVQGQAGNSRDGIGEDGIDWKSRYRALEFASKMAKGEFDRFRDRMIERLFEAILT